MVGQIETVTNAKLQRKFEQADFTVDMIFVIIFIASEKIS